MQVGLRNSAVIAMDQRRARCIHVVIKRIMKLGDVIAERGTILGSVAAERNP